MLDERYLSAEFLPFVDAARLRPLVAHPRRKEENEQRSPGLVETWRRAAHVWNWGSPGANADALAFWCAALGEPSDVSAAGGLWRTRWALSRTGSSEILGRHTGPVGAVATAVLPDGRPIAITGSWDHTVRIWDLTTATPLGDPLTGHTRSVGAVATTVLPDGRPIAATSSSGDDMVRIWDLTTGTPIGDPLTGHTRLMVAVATTVLPDGRPIAITGSHDATVRIWDLTTGTLIGDPLTGHTSRVTAVATAELPDGHPIAITGSHDATVRIWDLGLSVAAGPPLRVTAGVRGVALRRSGRDVIAVIVGDGVARVDVELIER
jgi:WD40 repeat protein